MVTARTAPSGPPWTPPKRGPRPPAKPPEVPALEGDDLRQALELVDTITRETKMVPWPTFDTPKPYKLGPSAIPRAPKHRKDDGPRITSSGKRIVHKTPLIQKYGRRVYAILPLPHDARGKRCIIVYSSSRKFHTSVSIREFYLPFEYVKENEWRPGRGIQFHPIYLDDDGNTINVLDKLIPALQVIKNDIAAGRLEICEITEEDVVEEEDTYYGSDATSDGSDSVFI